MDTFSNSPMKCKRFQKASYQKPNYVVDKEISIETEVKPVWLGKKFIPYTINLRSVENDKLITTDESEIHILVCFAY